MQCIARVLIRILRATDCVFNLKVKTGCLHLSEINNALFDDISRIVTSGLSSLGVPGVPCHTQSLADQLTLFQPGGTDYVHLITPGTPVFSDLPTALQ